MDRYELAVDFDKNSAGNDSGQFPGFSWWGATHGLVENDDGVGGIEPFIALLGVGQVEFVQRLDDGI